MKMVANLKMKLRVLSAHDCILYIWQDKKEYIAVEEKSLNLFPKKLQVYRLMISIEKTLE